MKNTKLTKFLQAIGSFLLGLCIIGMLLLLIGAILPIEVFPKNIKRQTSKGVIHEHRGWFPGLLGGSQYTDSGGKPLQLKGAWVDTQDFKGKTFIITKKMIVAFKGEGKSFNILLSYEEKHTEFASHTGTRTYRVKRFGEDALIYLDKARGWQAIGIPLNSDEELEYVAVIPMKADHLWEYKVVMHVFIRGKESPMGDFGIGEPSKREKREKFVASKKISEYFI
ncbi:hypothetical protein KKH43_03565 [Patescibacteria group bacterium]|nr:hypothetical protein [Patescibacteria group bacterium]